ncbi:MAG: penicillin-binding protein 2 [Saprospiraceae bacterium]|nr:MAG: penicillin-binding protein 2 [Saprospiraceae bacterium]
MAESFRDRQYSIRLFFIAAGLLLIGYAAYFQLIDSSIRSSADAAIMDQHILYPARGTIYDRNEKLLVYNNPMYDLLVTYSQIDSSMDTLKFCQLLEISKETFEKNLRKDWTTGRFNRNVPFVFLSKIPAKTFTRFQESLYEFPGFFAQRRNSRGYPHPNAAHALGYIREVNAKEVKDSTGIYIAGDYIGASGLEREYEYYLRGTKGVRHILKNSLGREVGPYKNESLDAEPHSGWDLYTSLDLELQAYGEELLKNKIGSIVVLQPDSGLVLAMVSSPSFDPNLITINKNRGKAYSELKADPNKPFLNRSILAQYPPGSLFKPVVGLIGLQEKVLDPNRTIYCQGAYYFEGQRLTGCHNHATSLNLSMGIQNSCNAYFVTVFKDIIDQFSYTTPDRGLDTFNNYLSKFGLNRKLGIDFPGEKKGNYPTSKYFDRVYEKEGNWKSLWIRSLGIGQGELLMTNLQMANLAAILANRGHYYTPHLVKKMANENNEEIYMDKYLKRHNVGVDPVYFEPIVEGMARAVTSGTATRAFIPDIPICGKTGTAENTQGSGKDHSIFFAFAPRDNPKIAIAVYVENSGFGGSYAAPIASLMIEKFLKGEIRGPYRQYIEKQMMEANLLDTP